MPPTLAAVFGTSRARRPLYPALHKLEQQGWIESEWALSENNRRAKYYKLTTAGRRALESETAHWERLSAAINLVVKPV